MVRPDLHGRLYRTTLVEGNDKKWYSLLEPCERMDELIQLDAEFHEFQGERNVITIITDAEKNSKLMGFSMLMDDDIAEPSEVVFPVQQDDAQDADIAPLEEVEEVLGADIPEGQIVVQPSSEEHLTVNGIVLRPTSTLSTLRAGCRFYGVSTSGSRQRCFQRLLEYQKKCELELAMNAANDAKQQEERQAQSPPLAEAPSEVEQMRHRLTHIPYAAWRGDCVAHRARRDRHVQTGESHSGEVPTISFDFFYTKADGTEQRTNRRHWQQAAPFPLDSWKRAGSLMRRQRL